MREIERALTKVGGPDGWAFDVGMHSAELEFRIEDGGLVIDHEGSTEPPLG